MLTTPITELDVDPGTSDDGNTGDDTDEDTDTATQMAITEGGGGENNPYSPNYQGRSFERTPIGEQSVGDLSGIVNPS